jgi:hypothetical protein
MLHLRLSYSRWSGQSFHCILRSFLHGSRVIPEKGHVATGGGKQSPRTAALKWTLEGTHTRIRCLLPVVMCGFGLTLDGTCAELPI